ncbi:MAG TPA: hypothetical protein VGF95_14355 [Solirubrobacteraceae bacterium]
MKARHIFAAVVIVAAALTYTLGGSAESAQQAPTPAEEAAIGHTAVFQRGATAQDEVPGETLLTGVVRRVGPSTAAQRVWASITPTQDCVQVGEEGASACASPERLEDEPLVVGSVTERNAQPLQPGELPEPTEWAGVAENNVESINVTWSDGTAEAIPVVDNGFEFSADGRTVRSLGWTTDGATHTYEEGGR